jgi:SAM-dependent methyltransferase
MYGLQVGSAVADMCCGRGYSSVELALRGTKVQAVDFSGKFIVELDRASKALGLGVVARQGDAEEIQLDGSVCTALVLWNSLGYNGPKADLRILTNIRKLTHSGGSLVVELTTLEELSKEPYKVTERSIGESHTFRRIRDLDAQTGLLSADWVILDEHETPIQSGQFSQRIYPKAEIVRMMNVAGWSFVTDSERTPLPCEPTGTLFIGIIEPDSSSQRCTKCRGVLP